MGSAFHELWDSNVTAPTAIRLWETFTSKPEILSRIAQATVALTKLNAIWRAKNISWTKGESDALLYQVHISVTL